MELSDLAQDLAAEGGLTLREIMAKVDLSAEQVARLCGISRRQLSYWTKKGILKADDGYTLSTLEKALLIKQELDKRASLRRAVQEVEAYLEKRAAAVSQLEAMSEDELRSVVCQRLDKLQSCVQSLRLAIPSLAEGNYISRLADEIRVLELDKLFRPPAADVTLLELATRLSLVVERLERLLAHLQGDGVILAQVREQVMLDA